MIWLTPTPQGLTVLIAARIEAGSTMMLLLGAFNAVAHILLQAIGNLSWQNAQQQTALLVSRIAQQQILLHVLTPVQKGGAQRNIPHQSKEYAQKIDAAQVDGLTVKGATVKAAFAERNAETYLSMLCIWLASLEEMTKL